jgi:SAM-dependent methyltransferase
MHEMGAADGDREIDWGRTSDDYARFRRGYPESFFRRLSALEVGVPEERVLDLGTGTGVLARALARRGCEVVGVDISEGQVEAAKRLAAEEGLVAEFHVAPAEDTGFPDASFDLITASQCWLYFDAARAISEVLRLLAPGGRLLTCHLCWLPRRDVVACTTEELVLKYNPDWSAADFSGRIPPIPSWAEGRFRLASMFWYDEGIPFTRESWRGRMRACRGVGATLRPDEIAAFDAELGRLLDGITGGEEFSIMHRIDAHLLRPPDPLETGPEAVGDSPLSARPSS